MCDFKVIWRSSDGWNKLWCSVEVESFSDLLAILLCTYCSRKLTFSHLKNVKILSEHWVSGSSLIFHNALVQHDKDFELIIINIIFLTATESFFSTEYRQAVQDASYDAEETALSRRLWDH